MTTVTYDRSGRVATISIERPGARNAVDAATADEFTAAMLRFDADDGADVAVLTGAPPDFCAGADLKAAPGPLGDPLSLRVVIDQPSSRKRPGRSGGVQTGLQCVRRGAPRFSRSTIKESADA